MSLIQNVMTGVHGRSNSAKEPSLTPHQQSPRPALQRSYTCKPKQLFQTTKCESQNSLFLQKPRACSTPTSPNFTSQRRLSYQRKISRTGSHELTSSKKSSVISFSEKISSIISIPCQVCLGQIWEPGCIISKRDEDKLGWAEPHLRFTLSFPLISP